MNRKSFFMLVTLLLILIALPTLTLSAQEDVIRQWASEAIASSEYSEDEWSAVRATGRPDTGSECADHENGWASSTYTSREEWLALAYEVPVYPTEINVYQNYNPGTITAIELVTPDGDIVTVSNSADTNTECPSVFSLAIEWEDAEPISGVIIYFDQRESENWTEIDAVELVGVPAEGSTSGGDSASGGDDSNSLDSDTGYTYTGDSGMRVTCDDGGSFDNGVEVRVVQMRTGFTYTATVIGLGDFDPILAVLNAGTGRGLCTDDASEAASFEAWLPTTGEVSGSNRSSQITFSNTSNNAFQDISLVVGGYDNASGEFILILEGMAFTEADGSGDPFALQITPGMIASGIAPTAYMIATSNRFDPLIALYDSETGEFLEAGGKDNYYACDDAGVLDACWGESVDLSGSYVSRTLNREQIADNLDAMLTLPLEAGQEWLFYNYKMLSGNSYGEYIVVFHVGID